MKNTYRGSDDLPELPKAIPHRPHGRTKLLLPQRKERSKKKLKVNVDLLVTNLIYVILRIS